MATLLCNAHPALSIFNPATGGYARFVGGKLEIEPDDPNYEVVMAEASRNPAIVVYASVTTCPHCGEALTSKAKLEDHIREIHFDKYLEAKDAEYAEARIVEVKSRSGLFCDVCANPQEFPTAEDLALHVSVLHTAPPELDGDGNEAAGGGTKKGRRRPGEVELPTAAPVEG